MGCSLWAGELGAEHDNRGSSGGLAEKGNRASKPGDGRQVQPSV